MGDSAVNSAVDAGVTMIVAAGNEAMDACNVSPAAATKAITVACSDNTDSFCYFSNYGSCKHHCPWYVNYLGLDWLEAVGQHHLWNLNVCASRFGCRSTHPGNVQQSLDSHAGQE